MHHRARLLVSALLSLGVSLVAARPASAQPRAEGFSLNRFEPSERGSDWFVLESLDLRGDPRFSAGLVIDYAHRPLMLYSPIDGEEVGSVVKHQLFTHVGGTVILWDRIRLGLNLPIALYQKGEGGSTETETFSSENKTTVGDLRLGADVRIAGTYGDPITLAGGLQLFAPTGSQASFTGDGAVRFGARLGVAGDIGMLAYAGMVGFTFRDNDLAYAGAPRGSEVSLGVAAGAKPIDGLLIGPELYTTTVVSDPDALFARPSTPLELIIGGHYRPADSVRVNAGIGPGLTRAYGTPAFRVLASLEWFQSVEQPPPPTDRDHDGILDSVDACPDVPGVRTDDPKTNGCPPPADRDGDSVLDDEDACPDVPGERTDDPKTNGCPDRDKDGIFDMLDACPDQPGIASDDPKTNGCPDRDKDGIFDASDACPDEAGVASEDPKKHGCPLPKDTDGDGIIDPEDACPNDPGPKNEDPKKNGCPVARVEKGEIKIREQVQFAYNSAQILKASDFILEAVKKILDENPQITHVSIEGHTDSKGGDAFNKRLSDQRAKAVMKWLVKAGIDASRLEAKGFGEEQPIDSNDTDEGRANNRRVAFQIKGQTGAPLPTPAPAP
jgi:outer membrane protein OmpA-like peptidoglycan-associated protein